MGDVCCLDKQVQENGLDGYKMVQESESTNRYLHKKFKKVATLEESAPKKSKGLVYSIPPEEPEQPKSISPDNRYVCPYCKVCVSKPSVLQKHIRAHTNERPYPCLPCGFAFKTKSNLYKHRRSRAHSLKTDGLSSEDDDGGSPSSEVSNKPYKPKFHLTETSLSSAPSSCSSPFSSSPSPDLLNAQINHLIAENSAMLFDIEGPSILHKETSSPLRNGESNEALQIGLGSYPVHTMPTIEPEDLSSMSTTSSEPLNLTVKEPRKWGLADSYSNSLLPSPSKESFVLRHREIPDLTRITEEVLYPCPNCKVVFRTHNDLKTHLFSCKPKSSPGPLLGKTPLVDTYDGDSVKKRKLDLINSAKKSSLKLFGGAVQVLDSSPGICNKQLEVNKEIAKKDAQVLMFTKTGLNVVGATIVQSETPEVSSPGYPEKLMLPIISNVSPPLLKVPGISTPVQFPPLRFPPVMNPLTQITAYNPLTLPTLSPVKLSTVPQRPLGSTYDRGVGTILLAGKEIPFVPGMPGPQTLLGSSPPLAVPSNVQPQQQEKSVIIRSPAPHWKTDTATSPVPPHDPSPVTLVSPVVESPEYISLNKQLSESKDAEKNASESQERKFLRPSSLPLKAGTFVPKKQLSAPFHTTSLISPETPRPRKSYGQLYLNGHAYTYLGLKCSTRMFFCTLNKPQPIYVPLAPDQYKVSMYSNWTVCSDASPSPPGLNSRKAMSCHDSRNRNCSYTLANRNKQDLVTHSSYTSTPPEVDQSPNSGNANSKSERNDGSDKLPICEGGFESNEEYTYVRGRGRGRYVCKECGIRCKKPSMLKKHIRTHTDLRPFTCKYCAFSFKTKGNLSKHMKSKAHYKRCVELDINPVPTNIDNCYWDDENSSQQSGSITPAGNDEESEETDEDEDDEDDDSEDDVDEGEDCRMEREVAKSLLSLSEVTLEIAHRQYITAGLVSSLNSKPRTYPYTFISPKAEPASMEKQAKADAWRSDVLLLNKHCQDLAISVRLSPQSELSESSRPMDLSNKSLDLHTRAVLKTPVITSASSRPHVMTTVCSTAGLPSTPAVEQPDDSALLHAYLSERRARDQHNKEEEENLVEEPTPKEQVLAPKTNTPPASVLPAASPAVPAASPTPAVSAAQHKRPDSPPCQLLLASPGNKKKAEFKEPASALSYISSTEDGKSMCSVCNKVFNKPSQLRLHVNIHYFERPFRCESCAVSFRTKGHLQKHLRSLSHLNKMNMNSTFGTATTSNPRPFKCDDCKIAFRIHGHLAKHFRSKMHIMKLECLGKLPFGMYAELERSGVNMSDIDTTDCENSLESLQLLAQKLSLDKPGTPRPDHWEVLEQQQRGGVTGSDIFGGGSASEDESSYSSDTFGRPCDIETRNETVR